MSTLPDIRVGSGFDVHAYDHAAPLRLAGLDWPGEPGLSGHSDGDAVCHAVVDALLGAAGLGDIGGLVGVDAPDTANAASTGFVRLALERLAAAGFRPVNVSVQIVGNRPKFSPRREEAERVMTELVGAPVSLSATTTDGLGFTGRGEGIAAIATALIAR
ncbi:2-C-methyl-D-erythritol 2,4-cyclodiphosphate synthase [Leucobacter albus]|uniref:2-C-methyl-D-erythritol 2,4-cyclodiphosphate synthase n=1 Tax=Leucobacter albus TaxID=272210 RepID=A0ABW3TMW7_9MICO